MVKKKILGKKTKTGKKCVYVFHFNIFWCYRAESREERTFFEVELLWIFMFLAAKPSIGAY